MSDKSVLKEKEPDEAILEEHITAYMTKVCKVLLYILIVTTIVEAIVCILIKMGYFAYFLKVQNNVCILYEVFVFEVILKTLLTWFIYFVYLILYKKSSYRARQILTSSVLLLLTTIFCFGHWKYSYLSILYSIPIVFTSPLGKKTQKIVLCFSLVATVLYSAFQYLSFGTSYNFLIAVVSLTTIISFYLISSSFYDSMIKALLDMERFIILSTHLNDEISHDYSTGAFSKACLNTDLKNNLEGNKEYHSAAFIDLDDFKHINDTRGHAIGDFVLKNIVRCFNMRHERIYRYGGDEFVAISKLSAEEFAAEIEKIKRSYNSSSKKLFSCDSTFSAGVISITENDSVESILQKCDDLMYTAKQNGKNFISVRP